MKFSNKITYLYGVYNGTRMFIGAINTMFLLNMGVLMGNIAILQMIQTITVLCMEVPTGIISDTINRKLSVVLSCGLLIIYYPLLYFGAPNMILLGLAQVVYAFALCFVSGAFEGWQTTIVKIEYPGEDNKLNYYGHLKYEINSFITMFSGTLGAVIVHIYIGGYKILFLLCTSIMIVLFFCFLRIPYGKVVMEKHENINFRSLMTTYIKQLKLGIECCFSNIDGWCYFIGVSLLVSSYQIVYYYWQPYFSILADNSSGFAWIIESKELLLGIVFFTYCFSRFIMNRFVRKILLDKMDPFIIASYCLIIASVCTVGMSFLRFVNIIVHIVLFAIIQGTILLVESILESQFIKKINIENISCSLSLISATTSILSIIILAIISRIISNETLYLFFLATVFIYLLIVVIVRIWSRNYNN